MNSVCLVSSDWKSVIDLVIVTVGIDSEVAKGRDLVNHDQKSTSVEKVMNTSRKTKRP